MPRIKTRTTMNPKPLVMMVLLSSCSFKFELTSQKTALENQIMGSYRELDDDLLVTNFERPAPETETKLQKGPSLSTATQRAQKNREFNADDIKELKDNAIIGEMADGLLGILPKSLGGISDASPEQIKLAEALTDEENRDRSVIWKSSIADDSKAKEKEEAQIRINFARDIFEKSPAGHWFYVGNRWTVKQ